MDTWISAPQYRRLYPVNASDATCLCRYRGVIGADDNVKPSVGVVFCFFRKRSNTNVESESSSEEINVASGAKQ